MKKLAITIAMALSPVASMAQTRMVLDCLNLGDGVEVRVCEAAQASSCEEAAATAVQLINQIRSGKKVNISSVKTLQEDESYEVGFTYENESVEWRIINNVFVSAGPGGCSVDSIRR